MTNASDLVDRFLEGKRDGTVGKYRTYLSRFLTHIRGVVDLAAVTYSTLEQFIGGLAELGANTKRLVWSIISSFYKFLVRVAVVTVNPCAGGCPLQAEPPPERFLTKEQVAAVIDASRSQGSKAFVSLKLLYGSGYRAAELCGLKLTDVTTGRGGRLKLTTVGKGRKRRTVTLSIATSEILARWVAILERQGQTHVFPGRRQGSGMSTMTLQRIAKRAGEKAGYPCTPHVFRHCFASHSLEGGANLVDLRDAMGHSSIAVTNRYLKSSGDASVADFL